VTVKPFPDELREDGSALVLPPEAMVMACGPPLAVKEEIGSLARWESAAVQFVKPTVPKSASGRTDVDEGASVIHSADDFFKLDETVVAVEKLHPRLDEMLSVNTPAETDTDAVMVSPGTTGYFDIGRLTGSAGYISHHELYFGVVPSQFEDVPSCSTVAEV